MDLQTAQAASDAIVEDPHPLLDYRSQEAKARTAWMVAFLGKYLERGKLLLDLGCGSGKHTFQAQDLGVQATGIDCSQRMIARANEIKALLGSNARFLRADYTHLPLGESTFNYALFPKNIVECSYAEYESVAGEVSRVLKTSGVFFLTMRDAIGTGNLPRQHYEVASGRCLGQVNIPGKGTLDYPTWFWTVAFAVHVSSRCFRLAGVEVVEDSGTSMLRLAKRAGDSGPR